MFNLESMLADEKQVADKLEEMISVITLMKKSILAKAFRGELGTNNLNEESSVELLKQILKQGHME